MASKSMVQQSTVMPSERRRRGHPLLSRRFIPAEAADANQCGEIVQELRPFDRLEDVASSAVSMAEIEPYFERVRLMASSYAK